MNKEFKYNFIQFLLIAPLFLFLFAFLWLTTTSTPTNPFNLFTIVMLIMLVGSVWILFKSSGREKFFKTRWESMKSRDGILKVSVHPELKLTPGEKIIMPITPCYIRAIGLCSVNEYPRDIIATNKRITIGFSNIGTVVIGFFNIGIGKETFGDMNLWHPKIGSIPETASDLKSTLTNLCGGNIKINSMLYAVDKQGNGYLKILVFWWILPFELELYGIPAKKIYNVFTKPIVDL